ncbi:MAG TPA: minor capsid protein [Candidatus Limosilactobacillus intestinavium]|nr:minor capsid protein [Candidatus Limosilactobacillus intestinavium]
MLSKKQQRKIIQSFYGAGNDMDKIIGRLYRTANRQIKGEISAFLADKVNWSSKPSKADIKEALDELSQFGEDVQPLTSFYASGLLLGHPKMGDVVTAHIATPMIRVASHIHKMVGTMGSQAPKQIRHATVVQHQVTPRLHKIPYNYDVMLQKSVSRSVVQRDGIHTDINRNIQQTISKVKDICKTASMDTDAQHNYLKDVDRVLNGKDGTGGSLARARTIFRTQTCRELNGATIGDLKARGVSKYRFLSLEASNTCAECSHIDGNIYDVDNAEEGINLPPMHPNCQCWIEGVEETDTDDLPTVDEMMDNPDLFQ